MEHDNAASRIRGLSVRDIRFPTSIEAHGSDALHINPDYSCAYVIVYTDTNVKGHGLAFTIGRGTELVVSAVKTLSHLVVGRHLSDLFNNFSDTWRTLTSDPQLRWIGPEKGVTHLAVAAIVNALWDLRARIMQKPLWRLLVDMSPQEIVDAIDFRYITDVLTKEEAKKMLESMEEGKQKRLRFLHGSGYPAYTTAAGWLGYPDEKVERRCRDFLLEGWRHFKIKVGRDLVDDKRRCAFVRRIIGEDSVLMLDANQKWDVEEAITWMQELAQYRPFWIEEPTSPDDVLGHATIAAAIRPLGIGVATGEMCQNRIIFKQLMQAKAIDYCQVDVTRMGGVTEAMAVYLMAKKFNVPVCPHAGGVGLCEMVQHLQMWDYVSVSGTMKNRSIEYVDHLSTHMKFPAKVKGGNYMPPTIPGFSVAMFPETLRDYEYPSGPIWRDLFQQKLFKDPTVGPPPTIEHFDDGDMPSASS